VCEDGLFILKYIDDTGADFQLIVVALCIRNYEDTAVLNSCDECLQYM
jgi:hypothetical protein